MVPAAGTGEGTLCTSRPRMSIQQSKGKRMAEYCPGGQFANKTRVHRQCRQWLSDHPVAQRKTKVTAWSKKAYRYSPPTTVWSKESTNTVPQQLYGSKRETCSPPRLCERNKHPKLNSQLFDAWGHKMISRRTVTRDGREGATCRVR